MSGSKWSRVRPWQLYRMADANNTWVVSGAPNFLHFMPVGVVANTSHNARIGLLPWQAQLQRKWPPHFIDLIFFFTSLLFSLLLRYKEGLSVKSWVISFVGFLIPQLSFLSFAFLYFKSSENQVRKNREPSSYLFSCISKNFSI